MFFLPRHFSLKTKIAFFTAILVTSAIWVIAHDLVDKARGELQKVLAARQYAAVDHTASHLEEATQERIAALADIASLIEADWLDRPERLHRFLAEHKPQYRMFNGGLLVISGHGAGLADWPHISGREGFDYGGADFFRQTMASGAPAIGAPAVDRFSRRPVVLMGAPVKDEGGRVLAVLAGAVQIDSGELFGEVLSRKADSGEDLHVVSPRDNLVVTSTDPKQVLQALPPPGAHAMLDRYRSGFEGFGVAKGAAGVEELSSGRRLPTTGWVVVASLPTSIAFESVSALEKEIYANAALSSVVIALFLWLFLHRHLTPLSRAAKSLDDMTQGRSPLQPLESEGSLEIRRLLDSFNRLQERTSRQQASLQEQAERLRLSATVFESSGESIVITDAQERILSVNSAFTDITGYRPEEVIGQTPRLMSSGRHDGAFYRKMWESLHQTGHWQGEVWDRRKSGEIYPKWLHISVVRNGNGEATNYIGIFSDISERKEAEARIEFMAYHDALTGLPNRLLAMDHLELAMAYAQHADSKTALLFLDLDNFKSINDSFGHTTGDLLLQAVAERLGRCLRDTDTVSRQGGDEFLLVLTDVGDAAAVTSTAERVLESLSATFDIDGNELSTSCSIGVAVYPDDGADIETLLKRADTAMYHAKEAGRNTYRFYTEQMNINAVEHHRIRVGLLHALERGEFVLHYQPQIDLASDRVIGAEALIRWNHPERGLVAPGHFIPTAEESGLIVPIGDWVLREACRQAAAWRAAGLPEVVVAVNVSAMQFKRGDLESSVLSALEASGLPPHLLELELTETILIHDTAKVLDTVQRLKAHGLALSIDDFGTGYSSLSYLKRFNVDKLKIDRSFICDMDSNPSDAVMVRAIIQMARSLNMKTIAEGVEDEHLLSFLRLQYCDEAQGYYFARPMPAEEFSRYLAASDSAALPEN